MSTFKKRGHLTKIRTRNATFSRNGHLQIRFCERCRIKDGISRSLYRAYGICSFCGRKGRMYAGLPLFNPPTIASPTGSRWVWKR